MNLHRRPRLIRRMANSLEFAIDTFRLARDAQRPPMPDHAMREVDPLLARDHAHQIRLDLARFVVHRELQATGDAVYVRIHHHSFSLPKPGTKNDVGRLARCTRYSKQLLHLIWNFAAEFVDDLLCGADDRL